MNNIIDAIKECYPQLPSGDYVAEFPGDLESARKFAIGVREQLFDLGMSHDELWEIVEQRNTNVYMRVWAVDVEDYGSFRDEDDSITSDECLPEETIYDDPSS